MTSRPGEKTALPDGVVRRQERAEDEAFLFALFRSHALPVLAQLPVDVAMKDGLIRMQFASRTSSYRASHPDARFEIVERHGVPVGRIVIDESVPVGCIVDIALLPEAQNAGLGFALMAEAIARFAELSRPVRCKVMMYNTASLRVCQKAGFVQIAEAVPYIELEWRPRG